MDQEANFGAPLSDPSNADFQRTIAGWQALTNGSDGGKLHIWNYVSSFSMPHVGCDAVFHDPVSCGMFIQPFPNYWVLGPNINFFSQMGVTGVFEVRREPSSPSSRAWSHRVWSLLRRAMTAPPGVT